MNGPRVLRRIKHQGKWMSLPIAKDRGGLNWEHVVYKRERIPAASGTFFLEYIDVDPATGKKKKIRRGVGSQVHAAKRALATQARVLELRTEGVQVCDAPEIQEHRPGNGITIAEVVGRFRTSPPVKLRKRSYKKYLEALQAFERWELQRRVRFVSQIRRQDILDFMSFLKNTEGLSVRTAIEKAIAARKYMKEAGAEIEMQKGDWPRVTEMQPEMYQPEDLKPLFAAMTARQFVLYQTFLLTGFRDQEVGFLAWSDFDEKAGLLKVTKKAGYDFDPKNYKERIIPIHPALVNLLVEHKKKQRAGEYFIFPTSAINTKKGMGGGQRDKHMLAKLKNIAFKVGLNCGRCHSVLKGRPVNCGTHAICRKWTLHKFRHTYATSLLHEGFDIVSVQRLLGHDDIESTMKYLRALRQVDLAERMRTAQLATKFIQSFPSSEPLPRRTRRVARDILNAQERAAGRRQIRRLREVA